MTNIFISHTFNELKIAQDISAQLKAKGHNVTMDTDALLPGQEWRATLWNALVNSDFVVSVLGDKANSSYTMVEIGAARALKKILIPVLVGNFPIPLAVQDLYCLYASENKIEETVEQICQTIDRPSS